MKNDIAMLNEKKFIIKRERYAVTRETKNGNEILCGLAKDYHFKPFGKIGDTSIKTYKSEAKARAAYGRSFGGGEIKIIKVIENIEEVEQ
jgi:hypothetical protein